MIYEDPVGFEVYVVHDMIYEDTQTVRSLGASFPHLEYVLKGG